MDGLQATQDPQREAQTRLDGHNEGWEVAEHIVLQPILDDRRHLDDLRHTCLAAFDMQDNGVGGDR